MDELGHAGAQFLRFIMGALITLGVITIATLIITTAAVFIGTLRKRRR